MVVLEFRVGELALYVGGTLRDQERPPLPAELQAFDMGVALVRASACAA
jgi:hypothetical protein